MVKDAYPRRSDLSHYDQRRARHIREHRYFLGTLRTVVANTPNVTWHGQHRVLRGLAKKAGFASYDFVTARLTADGAPHILAMLPDRIWHHNTARAKLKKLTGLADEVGIHFKLTRQREFTLDLLLRPATITGPLSPHTPNEFGAVLPPGHFPSP
ncbi:hypothetical protein V6617_09110 [Pelagibacterium nitratireducens]|uniref:Uncharacterized protein n=1 Tax=Pelagibacterium nitratireducens TaxID=1046114 RepID=A0ABZ2I481_9HYPH